MKMPQLNIKYPSGAEKEEKARKHKGWFLSKDVFFTLCLWNGKVRQDSHFLWCCSLP